MVSFGDNKEIKTVMELEQFYSNHDDLYPMIDSKIEEILKSNIDSINKIFMKKKMKKLLQYLKNLEVLLYLLMNRSLMLLLMVMQVI